MWNVTLVTLEPYRTAFFPCYLAIQQILAPVFSDDCACLQHGRGMYEEGFGNTLGQHFLYKCYLLRSGCPTTSHGNIFYPVLFREMSSKKCLHDDDDNDNNKNSNNYVFIFQVGRSQQRKIEGYYFSSREICRMECPPACFDNQP